MSVECMVKIANTSKRRLQAKVERKVSAEKVLRVSTKTKRPNTSALRKEG